jgi:hypothetical protein
MDTMLIKMNADDLTIYDEVVLDGLISPYTMGVNEDPDATLRNLVFVNYPPNECFMSPPPSDW